MTEPVTATLLADSVTAKVAVGKEVSFCGVQDTSSMD